MDARTFYLARNGETFGPYPAPDMQQMMNAGQISPDDQICPAGAEQWVPAGTIFRPPAGVQTPGGYASGDRKKSAPGAPGAAAPAAKKKSRLRQVLELAFGFIALIAALVGVFWYQDHRLWAYGQEKIAEMKLSAEQKRVHTAVAVFHHTAATNSGPKVSRRSMGFASKEDYWNALRLLVLEDVLAMAGPPDYAAPGGGSFLWKEGKAHYKLELSPAGTYEKTKYWDSDTSYKKPKGTERGTWSAGPDGFVWKPSDGPSRTERILCMRAAGFVLDSGGDEAAFWRNTKPRP